ncbi:hypothetical protein J6590_039470 [Homalodisca vitripennis]|nr:hypothetical protein J6590_039470 [Homalodisca vitripennis]
MKGSANISHNHLPSRQEGSWTTSYCYFQQSLAVHLLLCFKIVFRIRSDHYLHTSVYISPKNQPQPMLLDTCVFSIKSSQ